MIVTVSPCQTTSLNPELLPFLTIFPKFHLLNLIPRTRFETGRVGQTSSSPGGDNIITVTLQSNLAITTNAQVRVYLSEFVFQLVPENRFPHKPVSATF